MKQIKINPSKDLIFDIKVVEACKFCKRYTQKATCPPHIENIYYYKELLPSYHKGIIYYESFKASKEEWKKVGKESSLVMHRHLLKVRDNLFNSGHYFVTAFGSGSCKMCEECQFPCRLPNKSLIPMEATGLDVVEIMKKKNINIKFPVNDSIYRIGLILYD